jgi:hypothetical protein
VICSRKVLLNVSDCVQRLNIVQVLSQSSAQRISYTTVLPIHNRCAAELCLADVTDCHKLCSAKPAQCIIPSAKHINSDCPSRSWDRSTTQSGRTLARGRLQKTTSSRISSRMHVSECRNKLGSNQDLQGSSRSSAYDITAIDEDAARGAHSTV